MNARELAIPGAFEFTPRTFADDRGLFVSPFQGPVFGETVGSLEFATAQASTSRSRRGVVRGVHFTATPPGMAKYVWCVGGRALDIVVDLRVGSPTFGRWDSTELDGESFKSLYLPLGVGHAFVALEDNTVMQYMLSASYVASLELAVSVTDPRLGLPLPGDIVLSERDSAAPTLAEAAAQGLLPDYETCLSLGKAI